MHSKKLKKLCCIALTAVLAASVCGCKTKADPEQAEAIQHAQEAQQAAEDGTTVEEEQAAEEKAALYEQLHLQPIPEDDPLWADAEFELPSIAQLLAYKATYPDAFENVDADDDAWYQYEEDFWTVTAMGLIAVPPEGATDPYAYTHAKESVVLDYALSLIPLYAETGVAPEMDNIYGISGNPRSDIIDIEWIGFSVTPEIVLLGRMPGSADVMMRVHIEDEEGLMTPKDWDVALRTWTDGQTHVLPLQVVSFAPAN